MRILIQRVTDARVTVDGAVVGEIGSGFVLLDERSYGDTTIRFLQVT